VAELLGTPTGGTWDFHRLQGDNAQVKSLPN